MPLAASPIWRHCPLASVQDQDVKSAVAEGCLKIPIALAVCSHHLRLALRC